MAADAAADAIEPLEDHLTSGEYRRDLVRAGWPHGAIVRENTLDAYVARLRRKLKQLDSAPEIVTVHGVGYRVG